MGLTRCQLFALPDRSRATVYRNRLATAKLQHARWSAKRFATQLTAEGVVDGVTYRGRSESVEAGGADWSALDGVTLAGYKMGIQATLRDRYQVHTALLDYASRLVAAEMGCDVELTAPRLRQIPA